jgi:gag-polypeptide of LTR copia-type
MTQTSNNSISWQADYKAWKTNKEDLRTASKLLDAWVCEGIRLEIEDCENAKTAYDVIKLRYKVTNERARALLLTELSDQKLDGFTSMTEYINKLRQLKADLKAAEYDIIDDMFASSLLHGLPNFYRVFKEQYDWVRSARPDDPPDLDYLFDRLHIEEIKQNRIKEDRKAKEKAKNGSNNSGNNPSGGGNNTSNGGNTSNKSR